MKVDKIYKGKYAPNPVWYEYWIDLSADVYGGVIKYYNGSEWVKIADEVDLSDYAKTSDIPTNVSELANDANYVTSAELDAKGYQTEEDCAEAVTDAIADLVNSAPEALDTLYELAEALGNDPNFATTIATQLGQKVDTNTYEADKETFALKTEIPTKTSDLTNDSGYITSSVLSGYAQTSDIPDTSDMLTKTEAASTYQPIGDYLTSVPSEYITETELATELENYAKSSDIPTVPTKTSDLTNDSNFIVSASVSNIAVVTELPASPDDNTLYLTVSE